MHASYLATCLESSCHHILGMKTKCDINIWLLGEFKCSKFMNEWSMGKTIHGGNMSNFRELCCTA